MYASPFRFLALGHAVLASPVSFRTKPEQTGLLNATWPLPSIHYIRLLHESFRLPKPHYPPHTQFSAVFFFRSFYSCILHSSVICNSTCFACFTGLPLPSKAFLRSLITSVQLRLLTFASGVPGTDKSVKPDALDARSTCRDEL